jgi:hypothetical protein
MPQKKKVSEMNSEEMRKKLEKGNSKPKIPTDIGQVNGMKIRSVAECYRYLKGLSANAYKDVPRISKGAVATLWNLVSDENVKLVDAKQVAKAAFIICGGAQRKTLSAAHVATAWSVCYSCRVSSLDNFPPAETRFVIQAKRAKKGEGEGKSKKSKAPKLTKPKSHHSAKNSAANLSTED